MIYRALLLLLFLSAPGFATPVTVTSGEHDGFTRLVLDFGEPTDWQVGRTSDGYALQLRGSSIPQPYDLTKVFKLIGKGRLAAIWADPQTASLNIGIACACHAIPFEFRPGIVVIDLRDGAPPNGSSFELALDGAPVPVLKTKPSPRPRVRPAQTGLTYDWTDTAIAGLDIKAEAVLPSPLGFGDPTLQSLRDSLLKQLSRAATQGLVDLTMPKLKPAVLSLETLPAARITLGELPGVAIVMGLPEHMDISSNGHSCPDAGPLDLPNWGTNAPISTQMSAALAGIVGEFDQPDPTAVKRAVQFLLFAGFGLESRQMLKAFSADDPDKPLMTSLGYILDQEIDPEPAFFGFAACDTPAAIWAVLTQPAPDISEKININAVLRAFSDLPVHLRRHLGPLLAQQFLLRGDEKTAITIRNAITRAPGQAGPKVALLSAEISMLQGKPANAEAQLSIILADPSSQSAAAIIALTEARIAQTLPVAPEIVTALAAILIEQPEIDQPSTRRALVLAQAASGDFSAAFEALPNNPDAGADLWHILAKIGTDQAILAHAVLMSDEPLPEAQPDTKVILATRLLELGMADQALQWLVAENETDSLLLAQTHLARHDGAAALKALEASDNNAAAPLRALASQMIGDNTAAAITYAVLGDIDAERRATARARNWPQTAQLSPDDWGLVVAGLTPIFPETGPNPRLPTLADGRRVADNTAKTRAAIDVLLANTVAP